MHFQYLFFCPVKKNPCIIIETKASLSVAQRCKYPSAIPKLEKPLR